VFIRESSVRLERTNSVATVPVCRLPESLERKDDVEQRRIVLRIATDLLPSPSADSSWERILDFKAEMHDKEWAFRRFVKSLATKKQDTQGIRDDFEWTINEYQKAMQIHRIKASQSFVDLFVITPLEILENLVKINWSKIAKDALAVRKRKVELSEA